MVSYETITEEEWDALPPAQPPRKPSQWEDVVAALQAGEIVIIPVTDEKQRRGAKIGIGRLAKQRQIAIEYRTTQTGFAVRKTGDAPSRTEAETEHQERTRRRGRPSKKQQAGTAADTGETGTPKE